MGMLNSHRNASSFFIYEYGMRLFGRGPAKNEKLQFINYFRSGRGAAAADTHRAGVYLQFFLSTIIGFHSLGFPRIIKINNST